MKKSNHNSFSEVIIDLLPFVSILLILNLLLASIKLSYEEFSLFTILIKFLLISFITVVYVFFKVFILWILGFFYDIILAIRGIENNALEIGPRMEELRSSIFATELYFGISFIITALIIYSLAIFNIHPFIEILTKIASLLDHLNQSITDPPHLVKLLKIETELGRFLELLWFYYLSFMLIITATPIIPLFIYIIYLLIKKIFVKKSGLEPNVSNDIIRQEGWIPKSEWNKSTQVAEDFKVVKNVEWVKIKT